MTNTHKKRLIGKDDEMDRDVIGKRIYRNVLLRNPVRLKTYI